MWLHLSSYEFNPVCAASYTLRGVPTTEELLDCYKALVDNFPKYASKLTNTGRRFHGSTFEPDPKFDIRNHISFQSLPAPAGPKELDDYIAKVESLPWDMNKPLWEAVVLANYRDAKGAKAALVMRGHHTLTDGQGFVMSQLSVTSFGPELDRQLSDATKLIKDAKMGAAKPSKIHRRLKPLDAWQKTPPLQVVMFVLFWTFFVISTIVEIFFSAYQGLYMGVMYVLTFWRMPKATVDYPGPRVVEKEYATTDTVPMSDVKKIQTAFSGGRIGSWREIVQGGRRNHTIFGHLTLNDILCTVISDVIGAELRHPPPRTTKSRKSVWASIKSLVVDLSHLVLPRPVALMIPISIRKPGDWSMRNWSTGALAYLPNDDRLPTKPDALYKRLHGSRNALSVLKHGFLPTIAFWLINIPSGQIPMLFPGPLWTVLQGTVSFVVSCSLTAFTAVLTNVPGPQNKEPIKLAGQDIIRWGASPPQAGKGTLGIGVISYQENVSVTFCADKVAGSEGVARRLSRGFEVRFRDYVAAAEKVLADQEEQKKKR